MVVACIGEGGRGRGEGGRERGRGGDKSGGDNCAQLYRINGHSEGIYSYSDYSGIILHSVHALK
jgi:hypothetical protein